MILFWVCQPVGWLLVYSLLYRAWTCREGGSPMSVRNPELNSIFQAKVRPSILSRIFYPKICSMSFLWMLISFMEGNPIFYPVVHLERKQQEIFNFSEMLVDDLLSIVTMRVGKWALLGKESEKSSWTAFFTNRRSAWDVGKRRR